MAIRSDFTIDWEASPRVIIVDSPSVECTMQDLLDTLRWEESLATAMDNPAIVAASGKEPLGGGTLVGITVGLQNAVIGFEARSGPAWTNCDLNGGNLVAFDTDGATTINPVYPTAFVSISKTSSSSATLQAQDALNYSSYGGGVSIDITQTTTGTDYPSGNQEFPVNNLADAISIANAKGFKTLFIRESMTLDVGTLSNFTIVGRSHVLTYLVVEAALVCDGVTIKNSYVSGVLDGGTHVANCSVGDITYVNGHIHDSSLHGTIILDGNEDAAFINCTSLDQDSLPIVDMGVSGQDLAMPNYSGVITIRNWNDPDGEIGIGLNAGMIMFEDTMLAGSAVISGVGGFISAAHEDVKVNTDYLMNRELITRATWDRVHVDINRGEAGTAFPLGTLDHPSNNCLDAMAIAVANNINIFDLHSSVALACPVSGYSFEGYKNQVVDFNGQPCVGTLFTHVTLTGTQASSIRAENCKLTSIAGINGSYKGCIMADTTPLTLAVNANIFMNNCRSGVPGNDSPILDFSAGNISLNNRAYSGGVRCVNSTDPLNISTTEFIAGKFNFGTDNTAGYFAVRGVVDSSNMDDTGGATVNLNGIVGSPTTEALERLVRDVNFIDTWVYVDTELAENGDGTSDNPFNNTPDTVDYCESRGWKQIKVLSDLTLERTMKNFVVEGVGGLPVIDFNGQNVDKSEFLKVKLTGPQVGQITSKEVILLDGLTGMDGVYKEVGIVGNLALANGAKCTITGSSLLVGTAAPKEIDTGVGFTDVVLNMRKLSGSVSIKNMGHATKLVSAAFESGRFVLDDTNTLGTVKLAGLPTSSVFNTSSITIDSAGLLPSAQDNSDAVWSTDDALKLMEEILGYAEISSDDLHVTIRKRSDNTISHEFDISADKRIRTPV